MRVVVTGQSGLDKSGFLTQVESQAPRDITVFHVGERMCSEAGVSPDTILNLSHSHQEALRRSVMREIAREAQDADHAILNTHAVFRWESGRRESGLFLGLSPLDLELFQPDLFIVLIDDADPIKLELDRQQEANRNLHPTGILEILAWREAEIVATEQCAAFASRWIRPAGFFIVPKMHQIIRVGGKTSITPNTELVCDLIFEREDKKRAYPSFPISQVGHFEDVMERIIQFRESLRTHFIAFDPYDITEGGLVDTIKRAIAKGEVADGHVRIECRGRDLFIREDEVPLLRKAIWAQIRSRDFRLIDQSDFVWAYLPKRPDKFAYQSWGVMAELNYGSRAAKHTFIRCGAKEVGGPFAEIVTKIFKSDEDAFQHFRTLRWI